MALSKVGTGIGQKREGRELAGLAGLAGLEAAGTLVPAGDWGPLRVVTGRRT